MTLLKNDFEVEISIVLIQQNLSISSELTHLFTNTNGFTIIGAFHTFSEADSFLFYNSPHLILFVIETKEMHQIECISLLTQKYNTIPILAIIKTMHAPTIFSALRSGISGFVNINISLDELIAAMLELVKGRSYLSGDIAKLVIESFQKNRNTPLSQRESQVLEGIAIGKSRRKMAAELFLDIETIKTHIKNIYQKLAVNSKEEALRVAKLKKLI